MWMIQAWVLEIEVRSEGYEWELAFLFTLVLVFQVKFLVLDIFPVKFLDIDK